MGLPQDCELLFERRCSSRSRGSGLKRLAEANAGRAGPRSDPNAHNHMLPGTWPQVPDPARPPGTLAPLPVIRSLHGQLPLPRGQEQGLQPPGALQDQVLAGGHANLPPESRDLEKGAGATPASGSQTTTPSPPQEAGLPTSPGPTAGSQPALGGRQRLQASAAKRQKLPASRGAPSGASG